MTGQGGLDGYLGCFEIPDLPDHDDVGILPQNGTQTVGEGELDPGVHLDLTDPRKLVLHGVFYRDDVLVRRIYPRQGGVEGCCLTAPCRSGDQGDAVTGDSHLLYSAQVVVPHSDLGKSQQDLASVQEPEDGPLAETGGHGRNSDIDVLAGYLDADVQAGHDLDPGQDGGMQLFGETVDVVKNAIHTVTHRQVILERLHVDIAGPLLDRLVKHGINEVDDRGFIGGIQQVLGLLQVRNTDRKVPVFQVLDDIACRLRGSLVSAVDGFGYGSSRTENLQDLLSEQGSDILQDLVIDSTHSQAKSAIMRIPEREDIVFPGKLNGQVARQGGA